MNALVNKEILINSVIDVINNQLPEQCIQEDMFDSFMAIASKDEINSSEKLILLYLMFFGVENQPSLARKLHMSRQRVHMYGDHLRELGAINISVVNNKRYFVITKSWSMCERRKQ